MHYVYILDVIERKVESGNRRHLFYVGETTNILNRYGQHIRGIKSDFLRIYHPNSIKKLVYVEELENRNEGKKRKKELKKLNRLQKKVVIHSDKNSLDKVIPNFGRTIICLKDGSKGFIFGILKK